jgi:hypothetical protein
MAECDGCANKGHSCPHHRAVDRSWRAVQEGAAWQPINRIRSKARRRGDGAIYSRRSSRLRSRRRKCPLPDSLCGAAGTHWAQRNRVLFFRSHSRETTNGDDNDAAGIVQSNRDLSHRPLELYKDTREDGGQSIGRRSGKERCMAFEYRGRKSCPRSRKRRSAKSCGG